MAHFRKEENQKDNLRLFQSVARTTRMSRRLFIKSVCEEKMEKILSPKFIHLDIIRYKTLVCINENKRQKT